MTETETSAEPRSAGEGATGSRRKLTEDQEREVTRLYSETETPVSEISKRFGIGESSVYRVAQRHGASLRGRTATGGSSGVAPRRPRVAPALDGAADGRAAARQPLRVGPPPPPAPDVADAAQRVEPAAQPAARTRAAAPANGRRRRGAAAASGSGTAAASTGTGTGRGRRGGARTASAGTTTGARRGRRPGTAASSSGSGRGSASSGGGRSWRVSFTATRVFSAASMADAIRQAEAAGATEIVGIARND